MTQYEQAAELQPTGSHPEEFAAEVSDVLTGERLDVVYSYVDDTHYLVEEVEA